jgi:hypothetical protein
VSLEPQDSPTHPMAMWFADMRKYRASVYEGREPKPGRRRAAITMVHNEPVFLPIWLAWYSRFFEPDDIYVLDNETTDGSTDRDGFVRIPVRNDKVDHTWMVRTIESHQRELLDSYDVVVVTDIDEIVTPVPEWGTLGEYLDRFDEDAVNCLGYELLHDPRTEPPLRLDRPILDQRRHWFINDGYDKAAITGAPITWKPGFHQRADGGQFNPDPDLRLIHLHRMDYEICRDRHRTRKRRAWAEEDATKGWALHNQITDDAEFERWFSEDSCFEGVPIQLEKIPPSWKGLF